ncbi:hypothetical protein GGI03_001409 [Coemansia sp. RSA 2337]|nr:hypothetical protein LPJ71_002024 [Coemansia sp. S17]KAJ2017525.1 hypothetical protein GGI14_002927 [Coemansia sp. S680]KAJ2039315.1 hypothetical protein H4S03_001777 [Coemansia sp. S3946]KAJ2047844.1 hypothetical protein H4S04_004193 [Coemansia sp. S16]KAJ2068081.1 hypothetical protein GGI08_001064 [Coemansia sp. S2]KAJ2102496.1 hypothetical protein GGI09_001186 [Coemansia sp. S100]KAJ2108294.1 hypothetical protein GGI16_001197 [Coemansia sp. S142-1]KAJ2348674.1 hypothetical protein GGH9
MTTRRSARLVAKTAETTVAVLPALKVATKASKVTKERTRKPKGKTSDVAAVSRAATTTTTVVAVAPLSTFPFPSLATPQVMEDALRHLKAADPKLGEFIDRTVERCEMALDRDQGGHTSYISLCQSIIYQQLAGKAAAAILLRFLKQYGTLKDESKADMLTASEASLDSSDFIFPTPQQVAAIDTEELKNVGLGQRKAEYLKEVANKFNDGTLSDEKLARMSDSEVAAALVAIRGIGPWTADMFLMFHLKRTNILPTLDLAVRKAMCHHFDVPFGKKTPTHEALVEMGQIWEPYRSVATWYMWRLSGTITQKS